MLRSLSRSGFRGRRISLPSRRCQSTTSTNRRSPSTWSSSAVLGFAVAAGAIGWSIAEWQNSNISPVRYGSSSASAGGERFATLAEMNKASLQKGTYGGHF
ncbi:hypothetical protein LLEC1_03631 [Akanthomyces lecanii]|uniref:Uncharacterized protein n=1 Tax=Cordyceps confragosa TaxID=2714763 RepID=A0A179HYM5_CORDF|nr:hypothetical protein LLEC1_03631 [Akanthomyces lecanii]